MEFIIDGLDQWLAWLQTCRQTNIDAMKERALRKAGLRGLEYTGVNTPRRTGRLLQSLSYGAPENYFKLQVGVESFVVYGTCVEYAAAVETGVDQSKRKGNFVPGYWSSGTFHYMPGYKTGMVLTGKIIPGKHMFEKSLDYLRDDMKQIFVGELQWLWDQLNG